MDGRALQAALAANPCDVLASFALDMGEFEHERALVLQGQENSSEDPASHTAQCLGAPNPYNLSNWEFAKGGGGERIVSCDLRGGGERTIGVPPPIS